MPLPTKPGRIVTYSEEIFFINSEDTLITRSYNVTWQIKFIIPLLPQDLWLLKVVSYYKKLPLIKSHKDLNMLSLRSNFVLFFFFWTITCSIKSSFTPSVSVLLQINFLSPSLSKHTSIDCWWRLEFFKNPWRTDDWKPWIKK